MTDHLYPLSPSVRTATHKAGIEQHELGLAQALRLQKISRVGN